MLRLYNALSIDEILYISYDQTGYLRRKLVAEELYSERIEVVTENQRLGEKSRRWTNNSLFVRIRTELIRLEG